MNCPHCLTAFHEENETAHLTKDKDGDWDVVHRICPACERVVIHLRLGKIEPQNLGRPAVFRVRGYHLVHPKGISRKPPSAHVTASLAEDYKEACLVLADSPKSSAALGRRCLQQLLREEAHTASKDLADQIQEVLDSKALPSHLSDAIDAVRNLGNFAAHPIKSKSTGEIVSVEPGEAEWTLETLEGLFDFYFDGPAKTKARRAELDKKLKDAGKPPLKT